MLIFLSQQSDHFPTKLKAATSHSIISSHTFTDLVCTYMNVILPIYFDKMHESKTLLPYFGTFSLIKDPTFARGAFRVNKDRKNF